MKFIRFFILAIILTLASYAHADTQKIDVGTLIKRVIEGENFVGQELILSGVVLVGSSSGSGLINLGTQETYRSSTYVNFVSIYESTIALHDGTLALIRVEVEESSCNKIGDTNYVIIETVFRQCLSCKE
ncbi:hypothetical protein [uncultured Desulfosarcina sp.]|uniref:hypothetical protein n=1 Tax=uncultured Desulfosarcina sp. TaxID=218289 RepID=UPI0029C8322A|nr:hypothetical protein [uncultured Desulfosarcina sp.]